MKKSKVGQFNSSLKQLSPKSAIFSACGGLLQDDRCLGSPYMHTPKILHPRDYAPKEFE